MKAADGGSDSKDGKKGISSDSDRSRIRDSASSEVCIANPLKRKHPATTLCHFAKTRLDCQASPHDQGATHGDIGRNLGGVNITIG